jgi:hypothetical protein
MFPWKSLNARRWAVVVLGGFAAASLAFDGVASPAPAMRAAHEAVLTSRSRMARDVRRFLIAGVLPVRPGSRHSAGAATPVVPTVVLAANADKRPIRNI